MQEVNDEYLDDMMSNSIIIGDDPGEGMIVLINDEDFKGIYYWDHSLQFLQSSEEKNIYKIANSFKEFINILRNPELD